jgi:hypothetical protein
MTRTKISSSGPMLGIVFSWESRPGRAVRSLAGSRADEERARDVVVLELDDVAVVDARLWRARACGRSNLARIDGHVAGLAFTVSSNPRSVGSAGVIGPG